MKPFSIQLIRDLPIWYMSETRSQLIFSVLSPIMFQSLHTASSEPQLASLNNGLYFLQSLSMTVLLPVLILDTKPVSTS